MKHLGQYNGLFKNRVRDEINSQRKFLSNDLLEANYSKDDFRSLKRDLRYHFLRV